MDAPSSWDRLGVAGLFRALRDPATGFVPRLGATAAAAALCLAALMFCFGIADHSAARLRDEQAFAGVMIAIAAWLLLLFPIWSAYQRWRRMLRTILACLIAAVIAIAAGAFFGMTLRNPEFFIAGSIFAGASAIAAIIAAALHQSLRGKPLLAPEGAIDVRCPACGYSMAGLDACTCPECGHRATLDALIHAQDYDCLRPRPALGAQTARSSPPPALPAAHDPSTIPA